MIGCGYLETYQLGLFSSSTSKAHLHTKLDVVSWRLHLCDKYSSRARSHARCLFSSEQTMPATPSAWVPNGMSGAARLTPGVGLMGRSCRHGLEKGDGPVIPELLGPVAEQGREDGLPDIGVGAKDLVRSLRTPEQGGYGCSLHDCACKGCIKAECLLDVCNSIRGGCLCSLAGSEGCPAL